MESIIKLWAPVIKSVKGGYVAVLSDDSVDRDDEVVGKQALIKIKDDEKFIPILLDHENKIMGQVGEWVNRRIEDVDGHTTLLADAKFFNSNPKSKVLKGMLDEGATMGVSIGAIVHDKEDREVLGKTRTVFTNLEVVEASFVAVPSNKHARAMAIAKKYQMNKEVNKMTEEKVEELNKTVETLTDEKKEANSKIEVLEKEVSDLKKVAEETSEKVLEAIENKELETKKELDEVSSNLEETTKKLESLKKVAVLKAKQDTEGEGEVNDEEVKKATLEKLKTGQIPVVRA